MYIMIREGTAAKNLSALLPIITDSNYSRCLFATDDLHPEHILEEGHIDYILRKAVNLGLDPIRAVQMATINATCRFGIADLGAIAPGYIADMVVVKDLDDFQVDMVFKEGELIVKDEELTVDIPYYKSDSVLETIDIKPLMRDDLKIKTAPSKKARVIEIIPGQIITNKLVTEVKSEDGLVIPDVENDILKLAVIERHKATGNIGLGLVKGFGLQKGALASSIAHDSHNIVVVGTSDREILFAVEQIVKMKGGIVAVADNQVLASLPLPIAGLMSDESVTKVTERMEDLSRASHRLECKLRDPFITLSFLALPVIPELKLTDKGLVDVTKFEIVPLFEAQ